MTPDQTQPTLSLTRPADRSLAAFKEWVNALGAEFGFDTNEPEDLTEEEWTDHWREYWDGNPESEP